MYRSAALLAVILSGLGVAALGEARAQALPSIALKSGESVEVGDLWMAVNCRSLLKAPPEAEVLEGPSEVVVSVKEAMVLPRAQSCNKPVKGAKLVFTAKDIEDYSTSKLTVRITYHSKDGDRKYSSSWNISLFPKQE